MKKLIAIMMILSIVSCSEGDKNKSLIDVQSSQNENKGTGDSTSVLDPDSRSELLGEMSLFASQYKRYDNNRYRLGSNIFLSSLFWHQFLTERGNKYDLLKLTQQEVMNLLKEISHV